MHTFYFTHDQHEEMKILFISFAPWPKMKNDTIKRRKKKKHSHKSDFSKRGCVSLRLVTLWIINLAFCLNMHMHLDKISGFLLQMSWHAKDNIIYQPNCLVDENSNLQVLTQHYYLYHHNPLNATKIVKHYMPIPREPLLYYNSFPIVLSDRSPFQGQFFNNAFLEQRCPLHRSRKMFLFKHVKLVGLLLFVLTRWACFSLIHHWNSIRQKKTSLSWSNPNCWPDHTQRTVIVTQQQQTNINI